MSWLLQLLRALTLYQSMHAIVLFVIARRRHCAKFNYARLRIDKALGNFRDNFRAQKVKQLESTRYSAPPTRRGIG